MRSLSLKLTPPESDSCLSQGEMCALLQILLQATRRRTQRPKDGKQPPKALPLAAAMAEKKQRTKFVIPGMQSNVEREKGGEEMGEAVSLPLQSLEIGGLGMATSVLEELCFWCLHQSHGCILRDLIILSAPSLESGHDFVECLSLCGPLRRSLRRLVVKNCPAFRIRSEFAWALFFGTTPLEHLTLWNTGMESSQLGLLCEILCDNEIPQQCLRVLKLSSALGTSQESYFPEMEFVHVKRCLSRLARLEYFEVNCLTEAQKQDLSQEWAVIQGSEQSTGVWKLESSITLSIHHKSAKDELCEDISFEVIPELSSVLVSQSMQSDLPSHRPQFRVSKVTRKTGESKSTGLYQKPLLRKKPNQKSLPSFQERERTQRDSTEIQSIAEKLWQRFKPPTQPFRPIPNEEMPSCEQHIPLRKRHHRRSLYSNQHHRQRTRPLECYFLPQGRDGVLREEISSESGSSSSDGGWRSGEENKKRPKFTQIYSTGHEQATDSVPIAPADYPSKGSHWHGSFIDEGQRQSDDNSIDLEQEKLHGPPPGGRKVALGGMENDEDLKGYMSDGFIRPDDELVYTTSASDEEIEQDLYVLRCARRRMARFSSSESDLEQETAARKFSETSPPEETILVQFEGETQLKPETVREASSGRKTNLSALERELQELRPFYYDKNREKYQPGQFFSCEGGRDPAEGVTLRSGRHVLMSNADVEMHLESSNGEVECRSASDPVYFAFKETDKEATVKSAPPVEIVQETNEVFSHASPVAEPVIQVDSPKESHCPAAGEQEKGDEMSVHETETATSPVKRVHGSRETRRLQFWAWDHNFEKFPPNESMYVTRANRRRHSQK